MAAYPPVCRVCLAVNVNLLPIADTPLHFVYERLTTSLLYSTDMRPLTACYMCYALLRKSYKLMLTSISSENLLTEIVKSDSKITERSVSLVDRRANKLTGSLVISPPECIDSPPRAPPTANPDHQPPGVEALENVSSSPVEITIKEELDIKTEFEFEDNEASPSPSPLPMEVPLKGDDITMDTNSGSESETQQQCVIQISDWNEPGMSTEQLGQKTHITTRDPASSQRTLRVALPRLPGEKTYECSVCQRQFKYAYSYKNHLRTHTGEKPYTCHICQRKFGVKINLNAHLKTHTSEKPFKCELCGNQYRRREHLKRHIETHVGEKRFQCVICSRRFARKYHLIRHSSIHSDEKRFECNVCQRRFNNNHNLQNHLRTHTGEKLYSCDVCKREFKAKSTLRIHLMTNNGDKVLKCKKCKVKFHYRSRKGLSKMCKKCFIKSKEKLENDQ